jgi:hypothetical protein
VSELPYANRPFRVEVQLQAIEEMLTGAVPVWPASGGHVREATRRQKLAFNFEYVTGASSVARAGISEAGGRYRDRQLALPRRPLSRSFALVPGASAPGRTAAAGGAAS